VTCRPGRRPIRAAARWLRDRSDPPRPEGSLSGTDAVHAALEKAKTAAK